MRAAAMVCVGGVLLAPACRNAGPKVAEPIRLVDLYRPDPAATTDASAKPSPGGEWRFTAPAPPANAPAAPRPGPAGAKAPAAPPPWEAGPGVADLKLKDGLLTGRAASAAPIVHLRRARVDDRDVLHEVQVRMRASAGANLSVLLRPTDEVDLKFESENLPIIPWPLNTPIVAGSEMRTNVLRSTASIPMAARHLLIRPTDAAGATFEIESVRSVSRREHLAGIRAGMGWQGLGEVYRETLMSRAPDALRFDVQLPTRPRMQLSVGTLDPGPVTFRVFVQAGPGSTDEVVAQRTVTTPHRWETVKVDLDRFAGRKVGLSLALSAESKGALGFWGAPVIHDAVPPASGQADARPQGVIFIWADTLRRDHLPFYGYARPTAPVLARLASEGTLFEDAIAQASWTKASGPSMMTSLYPTSTGVRSFNDVLPSSANTLAEAFRKEGRATLALTAILFVGKFSNMHQGFEELHEPGSWSSGPPRLKTARLAVDRLLPWLDEHREMPFYVLLHVADPHSPFRPDAPYDNLFADPSGHAEHERQMQVVKPHIRNPNMRPRVMPTRDELVAAGVDPDAFIAYEKAWYDGSIRAMDAEFDRVIERLRDLGLDRRTLIVFTSDHGEEFLEHGRTFHQQSAYGELSNVPLFFWWPGRVPAGKRVPEMVQSIDIMPTLLELSGIKAPEGIQGASLVPFLNGQRNPAWPRPAITEASGRMAPNQDELEESFAISLDGWKLVHHPRRPAGRPEYELFDRKQDPLDQADVAVKHPEVVERLSKELQAWRKRAESMRVKSDSQLAGTLSAEELERLRALGYVQ